MNIRNFTGKRVVILNEETGERKIFEPEGKAKFGYVDEKVEVVNGIPITASRKLVVKGLPEKEADSAFLVPFLISVDLLRRDDIFRVPSEAEETTEEIVCSFLEKNTFIKNA